ncbi:MFS transporter [Peribacillus sp. SCS-155]|uniref:MFS transporter n=1 Tax=Peribacillus sedimenti TaxID=3115297 RepID=UPI003905944F
MSAHTTSSRGNSWALFALAVTSFGIGITEFISVGILPAVAKDFEISVTMAGLMVSLYALGVAVGAPILTSFTSKIPRKTLLLSVIILFTIGHGIIAFSPTFSVLIAGRILSAFAHGVFMAIATTIAASLVPENRRASAISIVFAGFTVATATGVPLGTFIGDHFGWRYPFMGIALIGVIALIANSILIPSGMRQSASASVKDQLKLVTHGRLLLIFLITILGYGGTFAAFTYLSPLLQEVTGFKPDTVSIILFVYGIAIAIGNTVGGKVSNHNPIRALFYMFIVLAVILTVLTFTAPFKMLALITVIFMGLAAFMSVPALQVYVVILAERYVPNAVDVASALNIAAFNIGIASGAALGGLVTDSLGLIHTGWVGALMVAAAIVLTGWNIVLEKKEKQKDKKRLAA